MENKTQVCLGGETGSWSSRPFGFCHVLRRGGEKGVPVRGEGVSVAERAPQLPPGLAAVAFPTTFLQICCS